MKVLLAALAAASALTAAAPAVAQPYGHWDRGYHHGWDHDRGWAHRRYYRPYRPYYRGYGWHRRQICAWRYHRRVCWWR